MDIDACVRDRPKKILTGVAVAFTLLLGFVDYLTGFELRIDVFYLMPISFAVWYISRKTATILSSMSILSIFFSDLLSRPGHSVRFIDLWNLATILLFFSIVILSLSKLRLTLEEQRRLSFELKKTLTDLQRTNESLESFSFSVSHDLRAPLRRIEAYAHMIEEDHARELGDAGKDYLYRVLYNVRTMKDIIEALLKLSRYSHGALNRSATDLSALVKKTLEETAAGWPERKVETVIAGGVTADGDPALLQVVVLNLIGNAWKFTKHRPIAKIEFGSAEIGGEKVYFVRDNGAGFSMENAKRLFAPFQRLHSESEFPGIGIGLATVRRIIDRHGGRIWAESEVDGGATFYFTLS